MHPHFGRASGVEEEERSTTHTGLRSVSGSRQRRKLMMMMMTTTTTTMAMMTMMTIMRMMTNTYFPVNNQLVYGMTQLMLYR